MTEYGDPANKTDFEYMYKYSPLHNVRVPAGSHQYPAILLTTGVHTPLIHADSELMPVQL